LVVIYGAFIVSLHATAERGVISFLLASMALFPLRAHGKGRPKRHKEGQDENTRGKRGLDEHSVWVNGTESHHLRFSYAGSYEL
jgi:hypothetical protein